MKKLWVHSVKGFTAQIKLSNSTENEYHIIMYYNPPQIDKSIGEGLLEDILKMADQYKINLVWKSYQRPDIGKFGFINNLRKAR